MEEVEKYKCELKKEQRERRMTEQRYIDIIAHIKTKLSVTVSLSFRLYIFKSRLFTLRIGDNDLFAWFSLYHRWQINYLLIDSTVFREK